MYYDITPVSKCRMTRRDKWLKRPCVLKYRAFKDECRLKNVKLYPSMKILFYMPMPKSWSKKKREEMAGKPHQVTPDLDNILKGLMDILEDDSHIWDVHATKIWSTVGGMDIYEVIGEL